MGLSVDPVPSKNAWAKELKISNLKLPLGLLATWGSRQSLWLVS
ncbi:peroxiredoxin, AhpC/TSA family domain protein [Desulfosporosinus sp. OT]|nr:peroxiredoxin, AhpC/TSA family domain protein [Desulfosporosinus sp. OT]